MKFLRKIAQTLLPACVLLLPFGGWAQNKLPAPSNAKLTEQEERGHGLFLQKCALCHLPKYQKPKTVPAIAPSLEGVLKKSKESIVRGQIMKGGTNMPGFQYTLEPQALDDLIAYLRTL
jgi:mono/diheme cytochrome c family protein